MGIMLAWCPFLFLVKIKLLQLPIDMLLSGQKKRPHQRCSLNFFSKVVN